MTTIKVIKTAATALGAAALISTMLASSAAATPAHGFGATISNAGNGTNTVVAPIRGGTVTSRRQHGLLNVEPAATPLVFCSPRGCAPPPKPLPPLGKPLKGRS